jgi:hypothetical protein
MCKKTKIEIQLELWKQGIETQMHFAELSIKMRQIGLTMAGATLALAVILSRTNNGFSFTIPCLEWKIPIATVLCISAAIILYAAKTLDAGMYHKMLRGAVKFNELLEQKMESNVEWEVGLTETISAYSRYKDPKLLKERDEENERWGGIHMKYAAKKIENFYLFCITSLLVAAFFLALVANGGGS